MNKKYVVRLSDEERGVCQQILKTSQGIVAEVSPRSAPAQGGCSMGRVVWTCKDRRGLQLPRADASSLSANVWLPQGLAGSGTARNARNHPRLASSDGEAEAQLIAMRLGKPPAGYGHWTLRLLADALVALEVVDRSVTRRSARRSKKRYDQTQDRVLGDSAGARRRVSWRAWKKCSKPTRQRTIRSIPCCVWTSNRSSCSRRRACRSPRRRSTASVVDDEYERNGTASIFLFAEPLSGFRQATARPRRTKAAWAIEVVPRYWRRAMPLARMVTLVCDNLNTHTKGAFYEAFEPDIARERT